MSAPSITVIPREGRDAIRVDRMGSRVDVRVWDYPFGRDPVPTSHGMTLSRIEVERLIEGLQCWLRVTGRRSA